MPSKTKSIAAAAMKALADPGLALLALRERGPLFILRMLVAASPEKLEDVVRGLEFRTLEDSRENLMRCFGEAIAEVTDVDALCYRIRIVSGETFLIRKAACMSDMGIIWETFVQRIYSEHPPLQARTVLDVGANLGDTAVYFAARGARVIAYEPSPEMFELAMRNAALNGAQVEFHNAGVGHADQTLPLTVGPRGTDPMSTTLFPSSTVPRNLRLSASIDVRIVPLADVLARHAPVFYLKMDCEGCEYPALLGIDDRTLRSVEHVCLEYHDDPEPLRARFERGGFSVRTRAGNLMLADRLA